MYTALDLATSTFCYFCKSNMNVVVGSDQVKSGFKKKQAVLQSGRISKNYLRRKRKKRSKAKYHQALKTLRTNRKTDELCSAVKIFDIKDMDCTQTSSSSALPTEIVEWHKQEQLAYWKSRAISLEMENQMLYEHLRHYYETTIKEQNQTTEPVELYNRKEVQSKPKKNKKSAKTITKKSAPVPVTTEKQHVNAKEPDGKRREEELKKIYGDKHQRVMGVENVHQLNYEKELDRTKPAVWPCLPLNL